MSAARCVGKYSTFFGSGLRAPHVGRQKMPVVRTPRKNTPLYAASRARYARCISALGGNLVGSIPVITVAPVIVVVIVLIPEAYRDRRKPLHRYSGAAVGTIPSNH